jgi:predicted porin
MAIKTTLIFLLVVLTPALSFADPTVANFYGVLDVGLIGGFSSAIPASDADIRHNWGHGNGNGMRHNYTSRVGMAARENLGGGNSIEARLEGTIDPNHTFYFDRQATISLESSLGTLRAGRTRDLINGAASRVDPFSNDGLVQDKLLLAQTGGIGGYRISSSLTYISPVVSGFVGSFQYGISDPGGTDGFKLLLSFDRGPFGWHAGAEKPVRNLSSGLFSLGPEARLFIMGTRYDFGPVIAAAELIHANRDMQAAGVNPALPTAEGNRLGWIGSLRVPVTNGEFKMLLVKSDMAYEKASAGGTQRPIRELGMGYEHFLSKQTFLYVQCGLEKKSNGGHWHTGMNTRF